MSSHWKSFFVWDGTLPLVTATGPLLVKSLFRKGDIAEICVVVLCPILAALLRVLIGSEQIRRNCRGLLPSSRQLALAVAIVLLILFEIASGVLTFADEAPRFLWLFPAGLYVAYLAFTPLRLRRVVA